jgi:glycosyltransferase involved in cell wall biosynthesis
MEGVVPDFDLAPFAAAHFMSRRNLFVFESTAPDPVVKTKPRLHFGFLPGLSLWWHKARWNVKARGYLARRTLTASQGTRDKLAAYYGYPSQNSAVLYHGVDTQRFRPSPAIRAEFRAAHGIPEEATVIVSHGRLAKNKRVERIIRAFEALSGEHQRLWLLLSAHGPLREEVERAVAGIDARHRVRFIGFQDDVSRLVQAGDIYVLASHAEGFGIALVEAMSAGLICVATNVSGPPEFIADGENGFLVEESDQGVLEGLTRAVNLNARETEAMQSRARSTAVERFDLQGAIQRALEAFQIPRRSAPIAQRPELTAPEGRPLSI